ncbi:histidine phosphatase family protein [Lutibacter sp. B2]|nr:histidine phosphatase family protein [Lutibacter sp. B2]
MTKLFLIRHGETTWNVESKAQGAKNIELSEVGRQQAAYLAERISKYKIDYIFSSDLDRAYETASIIGGKINKEVSQIGDLREMSFGKWEGLTQKQIKEVYKEHFIVWRNNPHKADIPDGERLIDVQNRALRAVNDVVDKHKGKNILIVSHGVTIKTIILGIMGIGLSDFYKITQNNTCINVIEYRDYGPVILRLNDTAHLENIK